MKTNFLLLFFITAVVSKSQLTIAQRTVANTVKTVKSGTNPIYKASLRNTMQVQSQVDLKSDSVVNYDLNFYAAPVTEENQNRGGSNACILQTGDNNMIIGSLKNEIQGNSPGNIQYTCAFSKTDFYKIIAIKRIKQIQIISGGKAGSFPIDNDFQETIIMQAKSLLQSIKTEK